MTRYGWKIVGKWLDNGCDVTCGGWGIRIAWMWLRMVWE